MQPSHKHVTIFISLLNAFFQSCQNGDGLKFAMLFSLPFFLIGLGPSIPLKYNRMGNDGAEKKFHTQMWHKYVKVFDCVFSFLCETKAKTVRKIDRSWVLCHLFSSCECENLCYCLNFFFFISVFLGARLLLFSVDIYFLLSPSPSLSRWQCFTAMSYDFLRTRIPIVNFDISALLLSY